MKRRLLIALLLVPGLFATMTGSAVAETTVTERVKARFIRVGATCPTDPKLAEACAALQAKRAARASTPTAGGTAACYFYPTIYYTRIIHYVDGTPVATHFANAYGDTAVFCGAHITECAMLLEFIDGAPPVSLGYSGGRDGNLPCEIWWTTPEVSGAIPGVVIYDGSALLGDGRAAYDYGLAVLE